MVMATLPSLWATQHVVATCVEDSSEVLTVSSENSLQPCVLDTDQDTAVTAPGVSVEACSPERKRCRREPPPPMKRSHQVLLQFVRQVMVDLQQEPGEWLDGYKADLYRHRLCLAYPDALDESDTSKHEELRKLAQEARDAMETAKARLRRTVFVG